jgi:nitrogen regulatory protein PII-like uncharacterized protein
MKKLKSIILLLILTLSLSLYACTTEKQSSGNKDTNGNLEDIMETIYDELGEDLGELVNTEVTSENLSYYIGVDKLDFEEALASEPMMSTSPHSVVLVRVNESTDIEKVKADIKEKVNPFKWVCVGVDENNIVVENVGNLILLVMDNNYSEDIKNIFLNLNK